MSIYKQERMESTHFLRDEFRMESIKIEVTDDVSANIEFIDPSSASVGSTTDEINHFNCDDGNIPNDNYINGIGELTGVLIILNERSKKKQFKCVQLVRNFRSD